ncbi:H/ACA ribonucleoprotein complex subunit GAR1-like [Trichoplusia ni]|uniref:H/ACA ribonucleoprotein complex subunit GAR1-like n=1 Tax=Trichoplusia ni TaxID=7111 RepID=A0A7E5V9Z3_TRINI|nr:H/ACA ribonucleoprotein complex subunit GAR1-like [Trichoplusia ni]
MENYNYLFTIFVVSLIGIQEIYGTKVEQTVQTLDEKSNPLANLILNENGIGDVSGKGDQTKGTSSRVKRQFYYDPYYYYRRPVPVPVPIVVGGLGIGGFGFGRGFGGRGFGFGGRGFGGRGFGGRGFGGRGFGGRGFGGRGFGGRGFGGRGFGGFGGRRG